MRQLPPMLSVSTGGMAVEGYFLLLRSAAFLVTPIPPSQSVNLARLLKHKTDSSGLLPPLQTNTHCTPRYHHTPTASFLNKKKNTQQKQDQAGRGNLDAARNRAGARIQIVLLKKRSELICVIPVSDDMVNMLAAHSQT